MMNTEGEGAGGGGGGEQAFLCLTAQRSAVGRRNSFSFVSFCSGRTKRKIPIGAFAQR
jgi:hypothetical protein